VPVTASTEEIEAAWRAQQRQHHPDIVGNTPESNKISQRINVARDWLTDPDLRAYYDAERGIASAGPDTRRQPPPPSRERRTQPPAGTRREPPPPAPPRRPQPTFDPWSADYGPNQTAVLEFLHRIAALTADECERLSISSPHSIAGLRRFLPPDLAAAFDRVEHAIDLLLTMPAGLPRGIARLALLAAGFEILAGDWLDREMEESGLREYTRASTLRAWERATKEPRYGRRHAEVKAIVERLTRLTDTEAAFLLQAHKLEKMSHADWRQVFGPLTWGSEGTSYTVACRDGESAVPTGLVAPDLEPKLRFVAARTAGLAALGDAASAKRWRYATDAPYRDTLLRLRRRTRAVTVVIPVVVVAGALLLFLVPPLRDALIPGALAVWIGLRSALRDGLVQAALALWIGLGIFSWVAAERRRTRPVIPVVVIAGVLLQLLVPVLGVPLVYGALAPWIGLGILSWLAAERRRTRAAIAVVIVAGALLQLLVPALGPPFIYGALALLIGLGLLGWLLNKAAPLPLSPPDSTLRRESTGMTYIEPTTEAASTTEPPAVR
jgi:hypothetical protein